MWIPTVAAWVLAWNRWSRRPSRVIDVLAVGLAVAGIVGAMTPWPSLTTGSRIGSLTLLVVIGARVLRGGPTPILAFAALVSIIAAFFGGELLDPIGVPGIWFPFGIGVSRTQYVYAIAIPLLAILMARTIATATASGPVAQTPSSGSGSA